MLTKAQVTYSNPEKSSYFVLQGVKEDGAHVLIYPYYNKETESLDDASILAHKFDYLGGLKCRLESCMERLCDYANGEISEIAELKEPVLPYRDTYVTSWAEMISANIV